DLLWERELEREPADTPERRAGLKRRLLDAAKAIQDDSVREEYRAELLARYDAMAPRAPARADGAPRQGWRGWGRRGGAPVLAARPRPELKSRVAAGEGGGAAGPAPRTLLFAALEQPGILQSCAEELSELELGDSGLERLRGAAVSAAAAGETVDKTGL